MKYPCGIIKDLLPLYIDGVCNEESREAVEEHLSECGQCRQYYEYMKASEDFPKNQNAREKELDVVKSLKKVKRRINKKIRNTIVCAVLAAAVCVAAFEVLFNMPIKDVDISEISVTAEVYPMSSLIKEGGNGEDSFTVSIGEEDTSDVYAISVPSIPNAEISVTENLLDKNSVITSVSWGSKYFIRDMKLSDKNGGDTLYIEAFKTTILNNKAPDYAKAQQYLEFREINRIVFVDKNGGEKVMWERNK